MKPKWLNGCEICNAGLCEEMDKFIEKHKLSERTAADQLSKVVKDKLGFMLYSGKQLRDRYRYHKGKDKVAEIPPPQGATTVKTKGNSKTAQRTSYTVGIAGMTTPKQRRGPNTDALLKLKDYAQALAEGLKQLGDGKIKSLSGSEAKVFEGIKEAVIVITAQARKLGIEIEK